MPKPLVKGPGAAGGPPPPERRIATRAPAAFPVRCRYESVLDFVETQSMNISQTGMFIVTDTPAPLGSCIDFAFTLADGFTLLKGSAEVVRVVTGGAINGMGVRFADLDEPNRRLISRIVAVNDEEGRNSTLNFDFSRPATESVMPVVEDPAPAPPPPGPAVALPIKFDGRRVRVVLSPLTVHHFTGNALLNVRSGGFFLPADEDVPLGTVFQVDIVDVAGRPIVSGKGKVVAKQELRVGLRLADADKEGMVRLKAEVGKLTPVK
ncbi:MAG: PilZ domain-containing protein [Bacteroidota bacterium]